MSTIEVLEQLKRMSNPDRLTVIEAATRLLRQDLDARGAEVRAEQDRRLHEAALSVRHLYEPGGELTEWASLDAEEVLDDSVPR